MDLRLFKQDDLFNATLSFFRDTIGLQLQTKSRMPVDLKNQFEDRGIKSKKVEEVWSHVDKTYYIGLLDDDNFDKEIAEQEESDLQEDLEDVEESDDEYPGILIFAVDLNEEFNPIRSNLTEINRTLNRFSQRVPALVLARYGNKISLMLADRVAYKQEWREGEKIRKVSLLRDIDLDDPHAGHLRILKDLVVSTSGTKEVESFDGLYEYWKEVLDTSELNKKFYQDLSNWYFWAIKHVRFPDEPTAEDAHEQNKELDDMLQEHRATNVIRLLTRLLFVWFIKEKGLIPEELFDLKTLQKHILKKITPHHEHGMFKEANKESIYYKAILQNLFFATLNCPIEASSTDNRERGFRSTTRGVHFGVTYLMRYEQYFEDKDAFLELVNSKVPFLNGGLFECLDIRGEKEVKEDRVWVDGFSDNLPNEHSLIVPDFLFFGVEEEVDLSEDYGLKSKKYKEAAVRGLLNIFKSYKFTITENTPIEEDVALDPELLGKVFENLLASYNPETKTTARKQTGSFYTPREIVNYMVDESLIAYLKNAVEGWGVSEDNLDDKLHQLTSYEETVPFEGNAELHREIITALSNCTILDPACGSGAFPMGILQKMVHILQRLDTDNEVWKEVQKEKAIIEADQAISEIKDKEERGQRLQEINEAFDERMNAPDYARKLFLIENCIYGVDIQPVATQISKLRFFISLVVEQKVGEDKSANFGIRPLPNLETKFVTANTLIEIEELGSQGSLAYTKEVEKLHNELRQVRSKLFSARTTETKYKCRQRDEKLRQAISEALKDSGMPAESADKLASWDPYDQNSSSPFYNSEWMFDILHGFDVVIGNPPYLESKKLPKTVKAEYSGYKSSTGKFDLFVLFIEKGMEEAKLGGILSFINPTTFMNKSFGKGLRKLISEDYKIKRVIDFNDIQVFDNATNYTGVFEILNLKDQNYHFEYIKYDSEHDVSADDFRNSLFNPKEYKFSDYVNLESDDIGEEPWVFLDSSQKAISKLIEKNSVKLEKLVKYIFVGIQSGKDKVFFLSQDKVKEHDLEKDLIYPILKGKDVKPYDINWSGNYVIYPYTVNNSLIPETELRTEYPNTYEYLRTMKKDLEGRSYFEKSTKEWYELWCERKFYKFNEIKIVNSEISPENRFAIDKNSYLTNTKIFSTVFKEKYQNDIWFYLGVLNSNVMNYYHKLIASPKAGGFYDYKTQFISKYPIRESRNKSIIGFIAKCLTLNIPESSFKNLNDVINSLIFEDYFFKIMSEKSILVSDFIQSDIQSIVNIDEFEDLSNAAKEKVIEDLKNLWSSPDNEVRKRINSFPEKSPNILKPILEG